MRCPACGKTIEEGAAFCAYCGASSQTTIRLQPLNRGILIAVPVVVLLIAVGAVLAASGIFSPRPTPVPTAVTYATPPPLGTTEPIVFVPPPTPAACPTPPPPVATQPQRSATPIPPPTVVIVVTVTWTPAPPTLTPSPSLTPAPTATRSLFPIRLVEPPNGAIFKEELVAPYLEWGPATDGALRPDEWYRIQVYHSNDLLQCNLYTKQTFFQLPASAQPPCDPNIWRFNTGDYNWRISLVIKVDDDVHHDVEQVNSEGRVFKWNK